MVEVTCPACRRIVDIPVHSAFLGRHVKCPKCWVHLEVISERPLKLGEKSKLEEASSAESK